MFIKIFRSSFYKVFGQNTYGAIKGFKFLKNIWLKLSN